MCVWSLRSRFLIFSLPSPSLRSFAACYFTLSLLSVSFVCTWACTLRIFLHIFYRYMGNTIYMYKVEAIIRKAHAQRDTKRGSLRKYRILIIPSFRFVRTYTVRYPEPPFFETSSFFRWHDHRRLGSYREEESSDEHEEARVNHFLSPN